MKQVKRIFTVLALSMICILGYAQKTVHGTVKDAAGEPMIGVTIFAGGKAGAITDMDGKFTLNNVSPSTVLRISYVGYLEQNVKVGDKTRLDIVMKEDNNTLNDVVVVGYGTMKKSDLTGAIASVNTDKLNAKGASTVMENLQGSVPGVSSTQTSSRAGGGFNIEIRGQSTLGSNKSPLYVVDGIICDDINFLNPQDIERIDILKDASSTAIYGSRATNGVVIVTTKSAKEQGGKLAKPTISYDGYYGITKATRMPDFMSGSSFAQYRHFRYLNPMTEQGSQTLAKYGAQNIWGQTDGNYNTAWIVKTDGTSHLRNVLADGSETDWQDLVMRTASQQNHYLSVSGNAGGSTNYHFGAGYQKEEGIYIKDQMERINLKGAVDSKINKWATAGISFNGAYTNHSTIDDSAIAQAYRLNPFCKPYDEDGNIVDYPGKAEALGTITDQFTGTANPMLDFENSEYNYKTYQFLANLYLEIRPIKDLSLKTTFSPSYTSQRTGQFEGSATAARNFGDNRAYASNVTKFSWTWDNQINYNLKIKDHNIGIMGLISASAFNQEKYEQEAFGVVDQAKWYNLSQASGTAYTSGSAYTEWSMLSYAARLNYSYKDRYLFTGTIRRDGSSRFAEGKRWGSFPSAAVAWRVTEEPFMAKTSKWLSNLKLRASIGVTGNNYTQGTNYPVSVVANGGDVYYGFADGTGNTPYWPGKVVNKDLTWEKTTEFNVGVDFGFLGGRINGSIDWYTKTSKDLLMNRQLTYETGGDATVIDNMGKVRNSGIEIVLNTVNVSTKDWNWTTSFTFSHNKNEILEVNGGKNDDISNSFFIGESINALYNYTWDGIVSDRMMTVPNTQIAKDKGFTPGESVVSRDYYYTCYGWGEGMPIISDLNGDGTIDQKDKSIIGKSNPTWTGSINSTLTYKNWDLSFSIYTKQNYKVYSPFYKQYTNYGDRGMQHIDMDFYIPDGALIGYEYNDEDGTRTPIYQNGTHYGDYPFPTNETASNAGAGVYWAANNAKDGADNMSSMATANKKGAPYQVVDGSYWKVKNICLGYTFPKSLLSKTFINSLRLYFNVTNPFVWAKDYKGFDPEWAGESMSQGGPSTVTYQFGASIKF